MAYTLTIWEFLYRDNLMKKLLKLIACLIISSSLSTSTSCSRIGIYIDKDARPHCCAKKSIWPKRQQKIHPLEYTISGLILGGLCGTGCALTDTHITRFWPTRILSWILWSSIRRSMVNGAYPPQVQGDPDHNALDNIAWASDWITYLYLMYR